MTSADGPLLERTRIQDLFRQLGERLERRGVVGDLYVIGGEALALAYDAHRATRDMEHLLAMKMLAARRRDTDDMRLLVKQLGLTEPERVIALCTRVFPAEALPDRARLNARGPVRADRARPRWGGMTADRPWDPVFSPLLAGGTRTCVTE